MESLLVRPEALEHVATVLGSARVPLRLGNQQEGGQVFRPCEKRMLRDPSGKSQQVRLHVYDLEIFDMDLKWISVLSGVPLYHLGIEVFGLEFFYGVEGILCVTPGTYDRQRRRQIIPIGYTDFEGLGVLRMVRQMEQEWSGDEYRVVGKNCQTFALEFARRLGLNEKCIPCDLLRFADSIQGPVPGGDERTLMAPCEGSATPSAIRL